MPETHINAMFVGFRRLLYPFFINLSAVSLELSSAASFFISFRILHIPIYVPALLYAKYHLFSLLFYTLDILF